MLKTEDAGNRLALKILRPLAAYYERDDIEEIAVNTPGQVWIKPRRGGWDCQEAPELTYEYLSRHVCRTLANLNRARFDENEVPIVSCAVPGQPFRFQAIVGRNVFYDQGDSRGVALAVRSLKKDSNLTMDAFVPRGLDLPGLQRLLASIDGVSDHIDRIQQAVERGLSILVSGATSSGKTTFMGQLLRMIPGDARVITVEDTPELVVPHANRVHLLVPRNVSVNAVGWSEILDVLVRITPDFLILGEISQKNAESVFSLMSKGHPVFSTVHAATPDEAMRSIVNNMAMSKANHNPEAVLETLRAQVGCIIQLDRYGHERRVVDIQFPALDRLREAGREAGNP